MTSTKVVDELVPHPVKEQLPGVDYCLNSNPSWGMFFTHTHLYACTNKRVRVICYNLNASNKCQKDDMIFAQITE